MDQLGCWSTLFYGENKKMGLHVTVRFLFTVSFFFFAQGKGAALKDKRWIHFTKRTWKI
jgi:hypothetical protein